MKQFLLTITGLFFVFGLIAQPVITQNPQHTTTCSDSCALFNISAVGTGLNFTWFTLDSAQNALQIGVGDTLVLCDSIVQYQLAVFYCVVTDMNGDSAVSSQAQLTVDSCIAPEADFEFTWDWEMREVCFINTSKRDETVLWIFGDGTTNASNQDSICHTYDSLELFYVKLYAFNSYGEDVVEKSIDLLGIAPLSVKFNVFPNPADDRVYVQSTEHITHVRLLDLKGQQVKFQIIDSAQGEVSLTDLPAGIYVMAIEAGGKTLYRQVVKR